MILGVRTVRTVRFLVLAIVLLAGVSRPARAVDQRNITYILPTYGFVGLSDAELDAQIQLLRTRIGEGPYIKVGFTGYISISMTDWSVNTTSPSAVRAALSDTFAQIDAAVAKARAHNIPICLAFLTAIRDQYDPLQRAAESEDVRNVQWHGDNTFARGWVTYSRYARRLHATEEAYIREIGKYVAQLMRLYPETLVAATGDGEIELSNDHVTIEPDTPASMLCDYSPFAVAEFRDWLRGDGLYAAGGPYAAEAYSLAARYAGDASPAEDTNHDGHTLNSDFGTSFKTWDLRYANWSLYDATAPDPGAIALATGTAAGWSPTESPFGAAAFDAPRTRGTAWWTVFDQFRQTMVWHYNLDFAKWMTTSADDTGATVPSDRWYSDQIPADYLFGFTPENPQTRLLTSASPWWTADVWPYGNIGITAYNVNINGQYGRTLAGVIEPLAARNRRFGLTEWNPSTPTSPDIDIYRQEMAIVERYHPALLIPFAWGNPYYQILGSPFETALKELVDAEKDGWTALLASPETLRFAATKNGASGALLATTGTQTVTVKFTGAATSWTATADQRWVQLTNASGSGAGQLQVAIINPDNVLGGSTSVTANVTVIPAKAGLAPFTVPVTLMIDQTGGAAMTAPFGQVDTPVQNATGVAGTIAVTGWALDDVGVASVKIFRNCLTFENQANCQTVGGQNVVYIGDAVFLSGARTDVEAGFSTYPQANRAGWGFLLLTIFLPHVTGQQQYGGQGPISLYAFATDVEGHTTLLGRAWRVAGTLDGDHVPTTITLANDTMARPFGVIDTPGQGATVSKRLANFGWALTPDGNTIAGDSDDISIPTDDSTIGVYVDGALVGHAAYNQCRGTVGNPVPAGLYCNDDVSNVFGNLAPQPVFTERTWNPTRYRNLDVGRAPIAAFEIDTTTLSNGLHTIGWTVTDSAGRVDGIGSRFFTVLNSGASSAVTAQEVAGAVIRPSTSTGAFTPASARNERRAVNRRLDDRASDSVGPEGTSALAAESKDELTALQAAPAQPRGEARALEQFAPSWADVSARTGFDPRATLERLAPGDDGVRRVQIAQLSLLDLRLAAGIEAGYLVANGTLRDLPPGSHLDPTTGVFTWMPGPGHLGAYRLVFLGRGEKTVIDVTIHP
jgi:hypothetical protein